MDCRVVMIAPEQDPHPTIQKILEDMGCQVSRSLEDTPSPPDLVLIHPDLVMRFQDTLALLRHRASPHLPVLLLTPHPPSPSPIGVVDDHLDPSLAPEALRALLHAWMRFRKHAALAHQRFHDLFTALPYPLFLLDAQGRILLANAHVAFRGLRGKDLIGKSLSALLPEAVSGPYRDRIREALRTHQPVVIRYTLPDRGSRSHTLHPILMDTVWVLLGIQDVPMGTEDPSWLQRLYTLTLSTQQVITRAESPSQLLQALPRTLVEHPGGFSAAWIARRGPDGKLRLVSHAGMSPSFLHAVQERVEGDSPSCPFTRKALETGEPALCPDVRTTEGGTVWRDLAHRWNVRSLAVIPLRIGGLLSGVLSLCSSQAGRFQDVREVQFLEQLSEHLSMVLDTFSRERRRLEAEHALREREEMFRQLAEITSTAIFIYQGERFIYVNRACEEITGYSREELLSMNFWEVVHPEHREMVRERGLARQRGEPVPNRYEFKILRKDGTSRWIDFTAGKILWGGHPAAVGTAFDITAYKDALSRIEHLAFYDTLTHLPNRVLFMEKLHTMLQEASRHQESVALLFMDLVRFKEINDTYGHGVGDRVLTEVARRLLRAMHPEDLLARVGSDEFAVIRPRASRERALDMVRRIQEVLAHPIEVEGKLYPMKVDLGIALFPDDGQTPEELLRHADIAMYRARALGTGHQFYHPGMEVEITRGLEISRRLDRALRSQRLQLFFQPQFTLKDRKLCGAEALLRWKDPEWGWVNPGEFIQVAEERGMMVALGEWVLREACLQLRRWREAGHPLPGRLAINVSAQEIQDPAFLRRVEEILEETGVDPTWLEMELTERSVMSDPERAVRVLGTLRDMGLTLALDDFGIGHSALVYLKRFPLHKLKIDRSFVRDMLVDASDHALVSAMIAMAHTLGLRTLGEGVEEPDQIQALERLGCDYVQGFFLGKPAPPDTFTRHWLSGKTL